MRRSFSYLLLTVLGLIQSPIAEARLVTIAGWVSDERCGDLHTKPGGADCVRKCMRGGASVGHPEWLPQRMIVVADQGKKIWFVENPEVLTGKEGEHVRIIGELHRKQKSVHVEKATNLE
jgi:hypothetical protein